MAYRCISVYHTAGLKGQASLSILAASEKAEITQMKDPLFMINRVNNSGPHLHGQHVHKTLFFLKIIPNNFDSQCIYEWIWLPLYIEKKPLKDY